MKPKRKPAKPRRLREIDALISMWGWEVASGRVTDLSKVRLISQARYLLDYIAKLEGRRK